MPFLIVKPKTIGSDGKKLATIVSVKLVRKAAGRNLIKRRIRGIMRPIIKETGRAFTVIAGRGAESASFQELKSSAETSARKLAPR